MYQYILLIYFIGFSTGSVAQSFEEKDFKHYTTNQGLSDRYITGIAQDSYGFIWISTLHGLNRFDGSSFKHFLRNAGKNSIPDNSIFSMNLLSEDKLAIATDNGAQIINTKTLETRTLDIPSSDAMRYWSNATRSVSRDDDGNYGISTKTGFYIFSPSGQLKKRWDRFSEKDIGVAWMMFGSRIHQLPDGNIMQDNRSGLAIYDRMKNEIRNATNYQPGTGRLLSLIKENRDHFFFISTRDAVVINTVTNSFDLVDIKNGATKSFVSPIRLVNEIGWQTSPSRINDSLWAINSKTRGFFLLHIDTTNRTISCNTKKYFSDHFCRIVFSDNQKRLWVGTDKGLYMQTLPSQLIQSFTITPKKAMDDFSITSLIITGNKIFAGTNKNGIFILNKFSKQVIKRIFLSSFQNEPMVIRSFLLIHPDTLWVATSAGLRWLHTRNYMSAIIKENEVLDATTRLLFLFRDSKRNIWIATNQINKIILYNAGYRQFKILNREKNELLKVGAVNSFAEDKQGRIWIGGDAIARWNPGFQKLDTLIEHLPTQKNRKKGYLVMSDSKGAIWVTINDDGIARLTGTSIHIRPENLLYDHSIDVYPGLLQDKIYMGTASGIGFLNVADQRSTVFHHADGLPDQKITSFHFSYDHYDKSVWFAAKTSIGKLPSISGTNYSNPPALRVAEVQVINDTIINYPSSAIRLKHGQNDIKVSFSAVNYNDPQNMRFAYRIVEENNSTWIESSTQQNILLTNIAPGRYKLQVKVYAFDNKWPEQIKETEIVIRPPFWKTTWFYLAVGLLIAAISYYLYNRRIQQIEQKAHVDKLMAQTEMKALHAQMNPHFIFNCLNSIREMILENENQQASHYLSKFAQLIRVTLNNSTRPFISLKDNIDYLNRYLEMEQIRTSHFGYEIQVDEKLQPEDILLPPMLIQPFIENAIWHNALPKNERMQLLIRFLQKGNRLVCIIEDNGIGIQTSLRKKEAQQNHHSVGISNIRQRIEVLNEIYGLRSSIKIEDKTNLDLPDETGTIVTLELPIKNTVA